MNREDLVKGMCVKVISKSVVSYIWDNFCERNPTKIVTILIPKFEHGEPEPCVQVQADDGVWLFMPNDFEPADPNDLWFMTMKKGK